MRKLYLLAFALLLANGTWAQPWMPVNKGPQKFDDIVAAHKKQLGNRDYENEEEEGRSGKTIRENKDHLFQKWAWYWQQHLDKDGYIVPTMRTWQEWQSYQDKQKSHAAKATANQSAWAFSGPDTSNGGGYYGIGRINVVAFHPTDPNIFWIGSAGGGAWRTKDGGGSWTPMYHNLMALGVGDIDYNPLNPNTIYLCTGDRDAGDTYSLGVMKSTDGGDTWNATGLAFNTSDYFLANTLVISPADTNTLLLAANWGIYRSTNGGTSWTNVFNGDFKEVVYCPSNPNVVFAAGIVNNDAEIYRSADAGQTWQQVTSVASVNRVSLAVCPANPAIVKAIFSDANSSGLAGIYSSSDTGHNFTQIYSVPDCSKNMLSWARVLDTTSCGGQGWYDLCIAMNPADPNKVVIGGVNTWYSADGGYNWQIATTWYSDTATVATVHADKHYLKYHPLVPGKLFECCDGGIYSCTNPIDLSWTDLTNGLGITEFYRNAVTGVNPFVIGGAQDNGTKAVSLTQAYELTGGDGMDCQEDYVNPLIFYTSSQNGYLMRTTDAGQNYVSISDNVPGQPGGSWITPFFLDPHVHTSLYAAFDKLYYSTDTGNNWTAISNVFDTSHTVDRIALSLTNQNYIYVLVYNQLYGTTNFGGSWNNIPVPYYQWTWISDIIVDPQDATHLWVTFGGYDTVHVASYWPSHGGWSNMSQGLPNVPADCITIDTSSHTKYIGTDVGVFYRDTTMTAWAPYNNGLPSVHVYDLGINYSTYDIWAATYGRGMWHSPKNEQPVGIPRVIVEPEVLTVSPNPNKGTFTVSSTNSSFKREKALARLLDANGRTMWKGNINFDEAGRAEVNAGNLAKGRYIIEMTGKVTSARASVIIY